MDNSIIRKLIDQEQQNVIDIYSPIIKDLTSVLIKLEHDPDQDDIDYVIKLIKERVKKCKKLAFSSDSYRNNIDKMITIINSQENNNDNSNPKIFGN